ncbi:hypothetical protein M3202_19765 [Alkalihalobacillus oceani]|uniref:Uncharacterized protein n=1 Tax=Halalkalibacter oceani TaxID=1653776 RepID=A0A9X2IQH1_9BACI|nr:hypothetical protein [Halalkalibacter oceani]MCM3716285.1 hypothetical protein [Halalkalibacter oceani]
MKHEVFQFEKRVHLIGDEYVYVHIKEARIIEEASNKGDFIGQIDIVYPFAGYNLELTLDITMDKSSVEWEWDAGFRVPFSEEIITLSELYLEQQMILEYEKYETRNYEKCSCGGYMMPMYDEFPSWIHYCDTCDCRNENYDHSPLPY